MLRRDKIRYHELPPAITAAVPESKFLRACADPEAGTVIVWVIDRSSGQQHELEFAPPEGRFLARVEREQALPPQREYPLLSELVRVVQRASLLADGDFRYEYYEVFHWERPELITTFRQKFFSPAYEERVTAIRQAVDKALFPYTYRSWSRDERISYWVGLIYRGRRQSGESSYSRYDENAAFNPILWKAMIDLDPDVDDLVPDITRALARMDMSDPAAMLAAFRHGTGTGTQTGSGRD